ncbi:pentapeptide repeat-containing protein [Halomonas sp. IOP_6]|nr:pentapeptide repeat-containing protein [Halomonas sp. IOP_6]
MSFTRTCFTRASFTRTSISNACFTNADHRCVVHELWPTPSD